MVTKAKGTPTACIRRSDNQSYCGRGAVNENQEFMFHDAEYAARVYRNPKGPITVCEACAEACDRQGVGSRTYMEPMATRGLRENSK